MEIEQLRALRSVVDEGTFDAAARALHITPSAVSQRIKSLETDVGRVLVQRTKPIRVTDSGAAVLRLARQIDALTSDALHELQADDATVPLALAVNADSLATWVLPALAPFAATTTFAFHREDQEHTASLLRDGTVTAAITSSGEAVRGCVATRLGAMRYRPSASRGFVDRWFPTGVDVASLASAPVVVFDEKDRLQDRYLTERGVDSSSPPRHVVPASAEFLAAVRAGFGWGMIPDQQGDGTELVCFDESGAHDVVLYWQQWKYSSPTLDRVAEACGTAAAAALRPGRSTRNPDAGVRT